MVRNFENAKSSSFNRFYLCGRVVAYGMTPSGAPTFVLAISKDAEDVTERDPSAVSLVDVAFGSVWKEQKELPLHTTVEVEGHIEGYDYRNEVWNKASHVQFFVADQIEPADSKMNEAFGHRGSTYRRSYSEFYIKGEVIWLNTNTNNAWSIITIRVGRRRYIRAQFLKPTEYNGLRVSCATGDTICATGTVSTAIKPGKDGSRVKFENLNIDDLHVISHRTEKPAPDVRNDTDISSGDYNATDIPAAASEIGESTVSGIAPETVPTAVEHDTTESTLSFLMNDM